LSLSATHATREHLPENIFESSAHAAKWIAASAAAKHVGHLLLLVMFSASLGITDLLVGCLYLLEFRFSTSISGVSVWVKLPCFLAKCSLDFSITSILADTKHSVWVLLRHRLGFNTSTSSILAVI
jgi:hypothetical protein